MLSTGLIDSFSSQVDVKGKIGPTSLKENVCQVSAYTPPPLNTGENQNFLYAFILKELSEKTFDAFDIVYMYIPEGV